MKTIYPILVTYHTFHSKPSAWINGGKPYADPEIQEAHFSSEEKAMQYVKRKSLSGTGIGFEIHHGSYEVEEQYI
jgi:hypothetical protein